MLDCYDANHRYEDYQRQRAQLQLAKIAWQAKRERQTPSLLTRLYTAALCWLGKQLINFGKRLSQPQTANNPEIDGIGV